jgi:succinoglycan biosynthesis transport protein ExoP
MDINQLIKIFLKHLWLLITIPVLLALIVVYLTKNQSYTYESKTRIYTGIASGYSLDQTRRIDFFSANNSFDNLINVIKSRETLSEVSIRLIAQAMLLESHNPMFISKDNFIELRRIVPPNIKELVMKPIIPDDSLSYHIAFEQTVSNFMRYKSESDTNFLYNMLNYDYKHYSLKALSTIKVQRIQSSDLVEISYESDDPGISLQTLQILTRVFITNFKLLRENQSDAIVKYFEAQVLLSQQKVRVAEDKLLEFNTGNQIINYYEQSKFIAEKKEDIEEYIQKERMKYAGAEEALKKLENKLQIQGQIQTVTDELVSKRNRLVEVTEKITINELFGERDTISKNEISKLKNEAKRLEKEMNEEISNLYRYNNTIDGLPLNDILNEWLKNLVTFAEAKAGLQVLDSRKRDFQKNYEIFAPLGATLKRIEREIAVNEQEYLSLLHSLNVAKLQQQNEALATNIKPIDPPYYPLSPKPSKRKLLVFAAGLMGFLIIAFTILLSEYFDNTVKTCERAEKITGIKFAVPMLKISGKYNSYNLSFITNRLVELLAQEIKHKLSSGPNDEDLLSSVKIITVFSTLELEGKTFIINKLVNKFRGMGEKILYLNYTFSVSEALPKEKEINVNQNEQIKPRGFLKKFFSKITSFSLLIDEAISKNADDLTYQIDETFMEKQDVLELVNTNALSSLDIYKYVFIEIPSILYYPFPNDLVKKSDLSILLLRANREWKSADSGALKMLSDTLNSQPLGILNGVEIEEIEAVLGTLPKKRSVFRKFVKNLINLQFYSKQSI